MKIIKSFLLVTVCICTANFLQAQELKTEVRKQSEVKLPPPSTVTNKPSPPPVLKPMNDVATKETPASAAAASSPSPDSKPATTPALKPVAALPIQDVPQSTNDLIPAPGTLKKHNQ